MFSCSVIFSYLGIDEVIVYHGHEGLGILRMVFAGQRQTSVWAFMNPSTNDLGTRRFPVSCTDKYNNANQFQRITPFVCF